MNDTKFIEFTAQLCGFEPNPVTGYWHWPEPYRGILNDPVKLEIEDLLFKDMAYSPIVRDLIENEMQRRGYWWQTMFEDVKGEYSHFFTKEVSMKPGAWLNLAVWSNSKTLVVASAAYKVLDGKL